MSGLTTKMSNFAESAFKSGLIAAAMALSVLPQRFLW
jgi:hypothetical protein